MGSLTVEIDEALLEKATPVFAEWGVTPEQTVVNIWKYAATRADDPQALRSFFDAADNGTADSALVSQVLLGNCAV